ncbi:MAG: calcium/sodium antiporter [Rhodospirillaceae bacterium]|nr:calcium/sodium antiporter [Rhodospirillaceae bacterium]
MIWLVAEAAAGLALLCLGGEWLVRGAVSLADRLGVSPLIIGLSVVAAGTSAPEMFVSLVSVLENRPAIAVGNVVGSNIANILLVLGAAALIWPVAVRPTVFRWDGPVLIAATAVFCALASTGEIGRIFGALMVLGLLAYLVQSYRLDRKDTQVRREIEDEVAELGGDRPPGRIAFLLVLGLVGVVGGAELLVHGAAGIAADAGVSETVIGVTLVAIGTSLPELATAIAAARHRHTELALGNVIGSCIFNVLAIVGIVSFVRPLAVPDEVLAFDLWVMGGVTLGFLALVRATPRPGRTIGTIMLLCYAAYIVSQFTGLSAMPAMYRPA